MAVLQTGHDLTSLKMTFQKHVGRAWSAWHGLEVELEPRVKTRGRMELHKNENVDIWFQRSSTGQATSAAYKNPFHIP